MKGNKLRQHLNQYFPQGHIHYTDSPQRKALQYKPLATGRSTDIDNGWTEIEMALATRRFEVPAGLEIIPVMPKLFHHGVLLKHNAYKCSGGGVKTPCPWCLTNKFVEYRSYMHAKRIMYVMLSGQGANSNSIA